MSIVYALIARQQNVLCEYTEAQGNFPTITRGILKQLALQKQPTIEIQSVFPYHEYNYYFLRDEVLTIMCMAQETLQSTIAFQFLSEIKTIFLTQYGDKYKTAIAYGMSSFTSQLEKYMRKYDNMKIETPLNQAREKMEKVKKLMLENVNLLMERGEKLDMLVQRTEKVQMDALKYEKTAKTVKQVYWWIYYKYFIYIGLTISLFVFLLTFYICGIDFTSCGRRIQSNIESTAQDQMDSLNQLKEDTMHKALDTVKAKAGTIGLKDRNESI